MDVYIRAKAKKVSSGLDAAAKARLWGSDSGSNGGSYESSGSEHEGLSSLVHAFFESDDSDLYSPPPSYALDRPNDSDGENSDNDDEPRRGKSADHLAELQNLFHSINHKAEARRLLADVVEASDALSALKFSGVGGASAYRRAVMSQLRARGHDAGLCKAKWESSPKTTKGTYEYIDVVVEGKKRGETRYIVDVCFAAEFEVARATSEYLKIMTVLPKVMVARQEDVKKIIRVAGAAVRRSLKAEGLHVPPWRKGRYMMNKWLGGYRRTVGVGGQGVGAVAVVKCDGAKCRAVGFGAETAVVALPLGRIW